MSRADLLVLLAVLALTGAGLVLHPGLLGAPGGEVYGHAWVQWWHGAALPGWPQDTRALLVHGGRWPVIDPLPTLLTGALGRLVGVVAAYDVWVLVSVGLAFIGGAALARRVGGDPWVGGLALAFAPALQGSLASGLTEDGAIGLAALALSMVGERDYKKTAALGVLMGVLAWCGLVLAWATALAALVLGLAAILRDRRAAGGLVLSALLALALAAPLLWWQGARLTGQGHSFGQVAQRFEPLWRLNPWRGVDLLSFFVPGRVDPGDALVRMHPGYLGLVPLTLALLAGRRWRWWIVLLVALALAPGAHLSLAGHPLGLANPFVAALSWLPGMGLINHHGRLLLVGAIALSALASIGARRLGRWSPLAALLVALDLALLSPVGLPLPVADATPAGVSPRLSELPQGAVLVVPVGGPGVHFQRPLLDQRVHGRRLLLDPDRPGMRVRTDSERWLSSLAFPAPAPAPSPFEPPEGVAIIVAMQPYVAAITHVLGPPALQAEDSAAWCVAPACAAE